MRRFALAALLALALPPGGHAADRPWALVRTRNLAVTGQQPVKTLRGIATALEQFRVVVAGLINNAQRPLPLPTLVYVFGTHRELEPFLPMVNGKPGSMAGYFLSGDDLNTIALQLETYDESGRIIYHEFTHLLLHNATAAIPPWLDEGLAEYYSTYTVDRDGARADIGRPIASHIAILRESYMPIAGLLGVDHSSPMYTERDRQTIFYAESWALTHYLMTVLPNGGEAINRYAAGIAKGGKPDDVFAQAFGRTPAAFDKDLRAYIHGLTFNSRIFTFKDKVQAPLPDDGRALAPAETSARLGDLLRRVGRTEEAAARIEDAAAAMPGAAVTQQAIGLLRLAQNRSDAAWPPLERAAALAPDDFGAQLTYGSSVLTRETEEERISGNPRMEQALAALTRATVLNPESSQAFALRAYAEMRTPGKLKDAAASIRRAMQLAPGRLDYLLRYADIFILAGSLADARTILTDMSHLTTDRVAADAAAMRLSELDKYEAALQAEASARAAAAAIVGERRAREAAVGRAETPSDTATVELDEKPRDLVPAVRARLRAVQRGEERAYGELTELECGAAQIRVHLKVGSRVIIATAKRMTDISLTEFLGVKDFAVACGTREPADAVYLTWRAAPARADAGATIVGQAVALEFVPRGFTP